MTDALKESARIGKHGAKALLSQIGIKDDFTVKVKKFKETGWVALYRGGSQFRPGGIIFWVNERLPEIHEGVENDAIYPEPIEIAIRDSLLHEYGHVIWEWARFRDSILEEMIRKEWGADEERFAEDFLEYVRDWGSDPVFNPLVKRFVKTALEVGE